MSVFIIQLTANTYQSTPSLKESSNIETLHWDIFRQYSVCSFCALLPEFQIQYEDTLHHPGHWHNLTEVHGTKTTAHLKLSPYVHYIFRVLALNAVGFSRPSFPSRMFKTEAAGTERAASPRSRVNVWLSDCQRISRWWNASFSAGNCWVDLSERNASG